MARVALVTGGASGIGGATAEALARDGLIVAVADANLKGAEAIVARLAGKGHVVLPVDIRDESAIAACFETVEKALGPVTVLAAILGLSRCAALEAAPMGFTVNTICSGAIDTPAFRTTVSDAQIATLIPTVPMGRMGTPEDIAELIRFLVTPAASYMTGCIFDINGGRHMA